jgi:hypothetical protein
MATENFQELSFGELLRVKEAVGVKAFDTFMRKKHTNQELEEDDGSSDSSSTQGSDSDDDPSEKATATRAKTRPKRAHKNMWAVD